MVKYGVLVYIDLAWLLIWLGVHSTLKFCFFLYSCLSSFTFFRMVNSSCKFYSNWPEWAFNEYLYLDFSWVRRMLSAFKASVFFYCDPRECYSTLFINSSKNMSNILASKGRFSFSQFFSQICFKADVKLIKSIFLLYFEHSLNILTFYSFVRVDSILVNDIILRKFYRLTVLLTYIYPNNIVFLHYCFEYM